MIYLKMPDGREYGVRLSDQTKHMRSQLMIVFGDGNVDKAWFFEATERKSKRDALKNMHPRWA